MFHLLNALSANDWMFSYPCPLHYYVKVDNIFPFRLRAH